MHKNSSQTHRAGWVILDSKTIFQNGFVHVESGHVKDAGQGNGRGQGLVIDHGPGLIMPSLVNAHTHLELTALKGKINAGKDLIDWVKQVIYQREDRGEKKLKIEAQKGIAGLLNSGCKLVGEISTLGLTRNMFFQSNIQGIWFKEYLGNTGLEKSNGHKDLDPFCSIAVHGPHTTHPDLRSDIFKIAEKKNLPVSIHLAESEEEIEFLTTGKGIWADFLKEQGIDYSSWGLPMKRPLKALEQTGLFNEKTIAVHLIHTEPNDFDIILKHGVHVCLCPRSNKNLFDLLPDIHGMLQAGIKPCLGTDSLASCDSLSMFDEMAFLAASFPNLPPETIFEMATICGARALGFDHKFGSLNPGKVGSLIYLPIQASNRTDLMEATVNQNHKGTVETEYL